MEHLTDEGFDIVRARFEKGRHNVRDDLSDVLDRQIVVGRELLKRGARRHEGGFKYWEKE
jgi:hypothetical protein